MEEKRQIDERRLASWIGKSVNIKGDVVSSGDLIIDGQVTGTIELGDHSLTIGPTAVVTAELVAKNVSISGKVKGNVLGAGKVELKATGSIEGDVTAPSFVMDDGASLAGKVDAQGGKR
ncbi:MAG: polymer-forming cytoskeletal protein [Vicinamibacterales bacterium]